MQILSTAAIAGLELDVKPFEFGVTNRSPEFISKFPFAKIPVFEGEDGFTLLEGASIARYGQYLLHFVPISYIYHSYSLYDQLHLWPLNLGFLETVSKMLR